jgi:hypothetical protein
MSHMLEMLNEVMYLVFSPLDVSWLRNKLSQVKDLQPLIWRICGHLSGGSAATYLEDLLPLIWFTVKIRLTQPQVELELGLSLAISHIVSVTLSPLTQAMFTC